MTVTVNDVRYVDVSGITDAAGLLSGVISRMRDQGQDFVDQVLTPVTAGRDWRGAGQPQACEVVSANAVAVVTAVSRFRVAVNTLHLFASTIGDCARKVGSVAEQAEAAHMVIAMNGSVDPGEDTSGDRKERAAGWTKTLQAELHRAERFDQICADTLHRLAGRDTGSGKGYALPVFSQYAGNDLLRRSVAAWNQEYKPDWTPFANGFDLGDTAWWEATGAICPPGGGKDGGGFLLGPDMRFYPIVDVDDTTETEGGGWHTLYARRGYDDFAPDPSLDAVAGSAIIGGSIAGGNYGQGGITDGVLTRALRYGGPVRPILDDPGQPYPKRRDTAGYEPGQEPGKPTWGRNPGSPPARPVPNSLGGLQIADSAADGAVRASHIADGHRFAYETVFQQNDQGEIRAVVKTYQVRTDVAGNAVVQSTSSHLGDDGRWEHEPMRTPPTVSRGR